MSQHTLNLTNSLKVEGKNVIAKYMAKQIVKVHQEVKSKLEETNNKYKDVINKHKRKQVFEIGDKVIMFPRHEKFPIRHL